MLCPNDARGSCVRGLNGKFARRVRGKLPLLMNDGVGAD